MLIKTLGNLFGVSLEEVQSLLAHLEHPGLTSAVWQGEVPGSSAGGSGQAGEHGVALQHITLVAAVADLIPDVESRALLHTIQQLAWIPTGVAWKGWNGTETKCFNCKLFCI